MPTMCSKTPSAAAATSSTCTAWSEVDFEDVKTVIATGLSQRRPQVAPLTVVQHSTGLRTGTDNQPILNNVLNTPQQGQPGTRPGNRPTTAA